MSWVRESINSTEGGLCVLISTKIEEGWVCDHAQEDEHVGNIKRQERKLAGGVAKQAADCLVDQS